MQSISRRVLACAANAFVAAGLLSFSPAYAQDTSTDWTPIRDALHADGIVQPGNVLCFDLVRSDLTLRVNGHPVSPGEVGNGYLHFTPVSGGNFFVDGALPALDWQANSVAWALRSGRHISVSAIVNHAAGVNVPLIWVHFEGTDTASQLLPAIVKALAILKDPQMGVSAKDITVPPSYVPPQFRAIFSKGMVTQINDIYAFSIARPDENQYYLGNVPANPALGVAETVFVEAPNGDGTQLTFNAEFALRSYEVQPVIAALQSAGFTVPALHDHFIDDHLRLYFVHAFAMGMDQASTTRYENGLYRAFEVIQGTK